MGKYSNIILVDGQGKIVDALKRVDEEMSSQRLVQPGLAYELPPAQNKPCMLECQPEEIVEAIVHQPKNQSLNKGILNALQGLSPVVCREIEHQVGRGQELFTRDLTQEQRERLRFFFGAAVYYGPGYGGRALYGNQNQRKADGVFLF